MASSKSTRVGQKSKSKKRNKTSKKKYTEKNYSENDLISAINAVGKGVPLREASQHFGVPKSTIHAKMKNFSAINVKKGPATELTSEEENRIVNWLIDCGKKGFPVTKESLLISVKQLLDTAERKSKVFVNNKPGRKWYDSFTKRHPELSLRKAQNLSLSRVSATEENIRAWFTRVKEYLDQENLTNIEDTRVFNLDESSFRLCPEIDKVLVKRGSLSVYNIFKGNEKETLTVLFTASAAGALPPPMVLFTYKKIPNAIKKRMPDGWSMGSTTSGWMETETFLDYVKNVFDPWLTKNNIQRPVVLYADGHVSHLSLALSDFCSSNQIVVVALYPNATHILQPLDVAFFHPLKKEWKKSNNEWRTKYKSLSKEDFTSVLHSAVQNLDLVKIMKNGFAATGLYPLNQDAPNYNVLDKNEKKNQQNTSEEVEIALEKINERDESRSQLKFFEKTINSELLNEFKSGEVVDEKNKGLFEYWLNLRGLSGGIDNLFLY